MKQLRYMPIPRVMLPALIRAVVLAASALGTAASTHAQGTIAFPIYRAEHALQGIYSYLVPPLWQSFEREAAALTQAAQLHCADQSQATGLPAAWSRARLAWMAASNPAIGPVITRRSQREIDFWPVRQALLQRALSSKPLSLAQMDRLGGPAKGFPAMEALLVEAPATTHCPYLVLIAEGIELEAKTLGIAFAAQSTKDWAADENATRTAFAEWINQWLGGLESLRWQQIEQPIQKARTVEGTQAPAFARRTRTESRADWQVQWASLLTQARLTPQEHNLPPAPGKALVPIEALLLGKGHIALALRWAKAIDAASAAMSTLPAQPSERDLLALSQTLKGVASLYQSEVAPALDVPLGFSSADGD